VFDFFHWVGNNYSLKGPPLNSKEKVKLNKIKQNLRACQRIRLRERTSINYGVMDRRASDWGVFFEIFICIE
jgi:hypothetical protein